MIAVFNFKIESVYKSTCNCQDSWKVMLGTTFQLLPGDQASPEEKPLALYKPIYQPRKPCSINDWYLMLFTFNNQS